MNTSPMRIVGALLTVAACAAADADPGSLWFAGTAPPNAASLADVMRMANMSVTRRWPNAAAGPVVPVLDVDGTTAAYMCVFRVDGASFPGDLKVVERETEEDMSFFDRAVQRRHGKIPYRQATRAPWRYSYVLVSARCDRSPILERSDGPSVVYALSTQLARAASRALRCPGPRLRSIILTGPSTYWFMYTDANDNEVGVSSYPPYEALEGPEIRHRLASAGGFPSKSGANSTLAMDLDAKAVNEELTERAFELWKTNRVPTEELTPVYVPGYDNCAPFYDWSYGCSPTAAAMVCGYWDEIAWYGRLVDYYIMRYDCVEQEEDYQVPNISRRLALAMGTDTLTGNTYESQIEPGIIAVTNGEDGYSFTMKGVRAWWLNDWAWSDITEEIGNGRPFVWSVDQVEHSYTAFGYDASDKTVFVHTSWDYPRRTWVSYNCGGGLWEGRLSSPQPAGPIAYDVDIYSPLGDTTYNGHGNGEVWVAGSSHQIRWTNFGRPASCVGIDYSTNGGRTWTVISSSTADDGTYDWNIPFIDTTFMARVRIRQYSGSTLVSGDGSYGDFTILGATTPCPPEPDYPPDGSTVCTLTPTLRVVEMPDADQYNFRVYRNSSLVVEGYAASWLWTVPNGYLSHNAWYSWRCRAHNTVGWGDFFTPDWTFRVWSGSCVEESAESSQLTHDHLAAAVLPNPCSQRAILSYAVDKPTSIRIQVFDVEGRLVSCLPPRLCPAGSHKMEFTRSALGVEHSGTYIIRIASASETLSLPLVTTE